MDENENLELINELKLKYPPIVVEAAPEPSLSYDIHGPRLIIDKIEIENFKSYGGVKILGPFHKNFTCVIGPNGSGKSNVIDALLFVFGFRASKIRSKKLSVLIHKSELFPNIGSCSVKVFFQRIKPSGDRNDDYEVIPGSEFVVCRIAFKDNSSVYKINEKKANGKEISDFLKKQGIDLDHNRFLILQGEVEQIALMKPKAATEYEDGLLEYLEDIIGSNRFKEPLKILYERLEELCELRSDKLNRVKIVAKEKKDLEGIRNEAVKYLRLCNEIVIRKNICFQLKMRDLSQLEASAIEKQNEVKEELNKITVDITRINQLRSVKEKELKEAVQNHLMKMQQFDKVQKQFHALEIEDAELRDQRKHSRAKIEELSKSIKQKEKDLLKYEKVPEESVLRVEQLTAEIKTLEERKLKENENQEKAQILLKQETLELQKTKDVKSEEFRKHQELLKTQEAEISSIKCQLDFLVGNYKKEQESGENLKLKLKTIEEKRIETKEKLDKLNNDLPKIRIDYKETMDEIEKLKKIEKDIKTELDQLIHTFQSGQSKENEHKVISFLLSQQKLGKLKGVIGRLGNLASVDRKYDVAFSTACGRLDSIVTAEMTDAQKCVELMKIHNVNRTAFIGLNKIQSWEDKANRPFQSVRDAQRAFDMLNVPDKSLRCAFFFALRDLLITDNIETARRINERGKKYRIVTLKGDLAEVQGAMTGGGDRQIKGKICLDPSKIHESGKVLGGFENINPRGLEQTIKEKEQKLNEISQRLNYLLQKSERLKTDLSVASNNQKFFQDTLNNLLIDKAELEKELVSNEEKLKKNKPDAKQVQALEMKIDKLDKKYKKDYEIYDNIKKEIDGINREIKSIGFAKLEAITSVLNSILEKIKEKSDTLKKINLSVKNAEKICKRTTVELDRLTTDKTNQEESFKEMDITLKALEVKADETLKIYEKIDKEVKELVKSKEQHAQDQCKIDEELQKTKQVQIQITRDFDEKKSKVDQLGQRIKQMQDEIKKLTLYPMPEGVDENDDDKSFMDLIGESDSQINIFSSQKDSHTGTKLKTYSDEELSAFKIHEITYQDIEDKLMKQKPNLAAIEEYRKKEEVYLQRAAELNEITQLRDFQKDQLQKMKTQRHQEFSAGFNLITGKLKEMYQMITMGGDAELELVDSLDPFSEGILFSVRPPKKSWKNISNLSGGEKTLSSLALVFALHHFKPTPFYVMDEIDAALDFKNVSIVANYLKDRTKNAQFIIISLRNNMYELSDRLVGICKPFNVTKTCVVDPNSLSRCLKSTNYVQSNTGANVAPPPSTQNQQTTPSTESEPIIIK